MTYRSTRSIKSECGLRAIASSGAVQPSHVSPTTDRRNRSGLIAVERTERSHQVLDALKRANYTDVQEPERVVSVRVDRGDR